MPLDLRAVTRETFTPHLGTDFTLERAGAAPLVLRLDEVFELPSSANAPRQAFGLALSAPELQAMPQHIARLRHPSLGELELFIVPAGPREGRMRYSVVFG